MAGTIVRVKRRLEDNPVDALVLSYKRRKTDSTSDATPERTLLTFAATVIEKDNDTVKKLLNKSISKAELEESYKSHIPNKIISQRINSAERSKENRFKMLSCNRSIDLEADCETENSSALTIVDVGMEETAESVIDEVAPVDLEPKYVYDIYSTDFMLDELDIDDGYLESLVSVEPLKSDLMYRGSEDCDEFDPYDEDSNDENNWKNDYPDSDHSINEDDMRLAASLHGMGIDNGVDLSSDSEDERYFKATGGFEEFASRFRRQEKRGFIDVVDEDGASEDESRGMNSSDATDDDSSVQ